MGPLIRDRHPLDRTRAGGSLRAVQECGAPLDTDFVDDQPIFGPRVVFIDDDPDTIDALRRRFRSYQRRWDMAFGAKPENALEWARDGLDMVICDLHMPVRGDVVLDRFRQEFPSAVRVLISGGSEIDALKLTISPAHRYLVNPCQPGELEAALESSLALRTYLADPEFTRVLGGVLRGPLFPERHAEFVEPVRQSLIGHDLRNAQALAAKVVEHLSVGRAEGLEIAAHWRQAHAVVEATVRICARELTPDPLRTHAVVAAYLHNVGSLLIARYEGERPSPRSEDAAAASVLSLWGLPDAVVEAVAFHRVPERAQSVHASAARIVHAAWTEASSTSPGPQSDARAAFARSQ